MIDSLSRNKAYKKYRRVRSGRLLWITGLSGAGKTVIAKSVYARLKGMKADVVYLDGDRLREVFGKGKHTRQNRLTLAMSYSRLCKLLCDQGIDVVCATISMFSKCHRWNRKHVSRYYEIYIRVPMPVLLERDSKHLYSKVLRGEIRNVVGIDLKFDPPEKPDLVINNTGETSPGQWADKIIKMIRRQRSKR